jgi:hypothetical protein
VLDACDTVSGPVPLLAWKPLSPPKFADTPDGYVPAFVVPSEAVTVATPVASVVPVPTELPLIPNAIVLPETGNPLDVNLAVTVAVPPYVPLPLTALIVVGGATNANVKLLLLMEPPVSEPPAVTVKLRAPTGVADVVVIVSVVVFVAPEPVNVAGENVVVTPVGALPPFQLMVQLPLQFPWDLVSVIFV